MKQDAEAFRLTSEYAEGSEERVRELYIDQAIEDCPGAWYQDFRLEIWRLLRPETHPTVRDIAVQLGRAIQSHVELDECRRACESTQQSMLEPDRLLYKYCTESDTHGDLARVQERKQRITDDQRSLSQIVAKQEQDLSQAISAVINVSTSVATVARKLRRAACRDWKELYSATQELEWSRASKLSRDFFALRSTFGLTNETGNQLRLEVIPAVNDRLIRRFGRRPSLLHKLSGEEFEDLIANLFGKFGFSVELIARTADKNVDIVAVNHDPVDVKLLIQCKRQIRRVGIEPVQRLLGTVTQFGASKGILVTTAPSFTKGANEVFFAKPWILEGRAFDHIVEWLKGYDRYQMSLDCTLDN